MLNSKTTESFPSLC